MAIKLSKLPICKKGQWAKDGGSPLINVTKNVVWVLHLFSLASWIAPFFQNKVGSSYYTQRNFTDYYLLFCLMLTFFLIGGSYFSLVNGFCAALWAFFIIIDTLQYQLRLVLLRPVFHKNYSPYSVERTLVILIIQYLQVAVCFALLYLYPLRTYFPEAFNASKAVEFSIVTLTTLGYGNITATPGTFGAIVASFEAMAGVFFLGLIISTAIGRAKPLTALDSSPKKSTLQDTCLKLLSSHGYAYEVKKLSDVLSGNLWIVGGWVRNSALDLEYAGDIDCLTTYEPKELDRLLLSAGYVVDFNRFGTRRFSLADGNHIDLGTTREQANTLDIVSALKKFNFSINAAAVNYSSGRIVYSESFATDIRSQKFHVTCTPELRSGEYERGILKDMEVIEKYYGLQPANDIVSGQLLERRDFLTKKFKGIDFKKAMSDATGYLTDLVPDSATAWVVRGYARCAYFGEIRYWDDIDVIVDCSHEDLVDHLSSSGANWTLNYFRSPKVFHSTGVTFDIWNLKEGQSIQDAISEFPHNVDSLAWPVGGGELIADKDVINSLNNRMLSINLPAIEKMSEFDSSYTAIKSVYLAIRHNLDVDDSVAALLNRNFQDAPLMRKHAINLVKELHMCGVKELFDTTEYIRKVCGNNEPTSYVLKYWELPMRGDRF